MRFLVDASPPAPYHIGRVEARVSRVQETRIVAAEEPICPSCGKPLLGRDRFEGTCAACRETAVLGTSAAADGARAEAVPTTVCPACGAANPLGLARCMACDARLHRRSLVVPLCVVGGVVALAIVAWALMPRTPRRSAAPPRVAAPPPLPSRPATSAPLQPHAPRATAPPAAPEHLVARVGAETRELLALLRKGDYDRVIDNYCQPDDAAFARVERGLEAIVHGDGAKGFAHWSARTIRQGAKGAAKELRAAGDAHADYTVALLTHLAHAPGASGRRGTAEDRARGILRWHLAGLFGGLELDKATIGRIEASATGAFVVELQCEGAPAEPRPGDDPRRIRWARLPVGWVVKLVLADRLEAVHKLFAHTHAP